MPRRDGRSSLSDMGAELFYRATEDGVEEVCGDGWIKLAVENDWLLIDSPEDAREFWEEEKCGLK